MRPCRRPDRFRQTQDVPRLDRGVPHQPWRPGPLDRHMRINEDPYVVQLCEMARAFRMRPTWFAEDHVILRTRRFRFRFWPRTGAWRMSQGKTVLAEGNGFHQGLFALREAAKARLNAHAN